MSVTTTKQLTLQQALSDADPDKIADALRQVDLGNMLTKVDETITPAAVSATITLSQPALMIQSVRVTSNAGGTGTTGTFYVGDAGATPSAAASGKNGLCSLSADGTTLTFEGTVAACRIVYIPQSETPLTNNFAQT